MNLTTISNIIKKKIKLLITSIFLFAPFVLIGQQNPNCLSFDGTNDYVSLGSNSLLKPASALTVEAWVNFNNWNATGNQDIVSTFNTQGYILRLQSGSLTATVYRNNATGTATYNVSALTGWHHVAFTFNGQYVRLYLDGSLENSNNAKGTYSITYNSGTNTTIGSLSSGASEFVNGKIDEVRIWSVVRTAAQLSGSMNTELATTTANLLAYYRFNEGTAGGSNPGLTTLNDLTSNSINGTLHNFALSGSTSNWVNGYPLDPVDQSTTVTYSNVTGNQLTANWVRPGTNKGGNGVLVFMAQASSGSAAPVDGTTYTANASFGTGSQIGATGWYCVYNGSNTSVTISNLATRTTYRVHVVEYQNVSGQTIRYNTATATGNPANQQTDYAAPTTQASNITYSAITSTSFTANWTRGNGTSCIVFIKLALSGSPAPVNNTTYTANTVYGSGSQIGTTGWYCIYNGTGTSVNITGLTAVQTYRIMVCEYNGTAGLEKYLTTTATNNPRNQATPDYTAPTTQASKITFSNVTTTAMTASWTRGNGTSCIVFIKLASTGTPAPVKNTTYTANSVYGSGSQIGTTGWYCIYNGTGTSVNITGLTALQTYRIMVCEYNGTPSLEKYLTTTATNNPRNQATPDYTAPTTQASKITFSNVTTTGMTASWTRGNGTNCIVFIKLASSGSPAPVKNTTYTANPVYGSGTQIGTTGWYCIYNGTGTTVNITGLTAVQTYRLMVCEYNGTAGLEKYLTTTATNNPNNKATIDYTAPTTQASNVTFSNVTTTSMTASWTRGNGTNCIVFIKLASSGSPAPVKNTTYTANPVYGSGTQIGTTGWYCIYNGTGTSVNITGLTAVQTYRLKVCEYNGIAGLEKYLTTTATNNPNNQATSDYTAPTTQSSKIAFSNVTNTGMTASWTRGNGTNCIVFIKLASTGTPAPVKNTTYTANSVYGSGTQIGTTGWYCIYNGTGATVNITGLTAVQTYRIMVCEYNGTPGLEKYLTTTATNNPNNQVTPDYTAPTTQASKITFSNVTTTGMTAAWTRGNGTSCIVFIKFASTGSPAPVKNTTYTANPVYGSGSQIGTTGWYCIYNGTGTTVSITGLTALQTYRLMVCEYNGTPGLEKYLTTTSTNNPNNQATIDYTAPTTQASNVTFSAITNSSFIVDWTRGNGSNCVVFVKQATTGTPAPVNNTTYTANTIFTNGSQIGTSGWYCVYVGTGTEVSITGFTQNTTYRVMVCEYNGTPGLEKYLKTAETNDPMNQLTISNPPTVQATNLIFSSVTTASFAASWTRGNGSNCIAFVKQTTSGTATPVSKTTYTPNTVFGNGSQIGTTGWFCVYKGTGTNVSITGLSAGTAYRVMVCEYNNAPGSEQYNSTSATNNPNNQTTDYLAPTTQAYSISSFSITTNTFSANWIRGNGSNCAAFIAKTNSGNAAPVNNNTYSADTIFMSGSEIGTTGWYCVYNGTGTSVNISGLMSGTTYSLMVCEYNGTPHLEKYNTSASTNNPIIVTTLSNTVWDGTKWTNGPPDANTDIVIAQNYDLSTNLTCKSTSVNKTDTIKVEPGSTLTVNGNITNSGVFILKSPLDSSASGSLINYGNITNNGLMYADRYISMGGLQPNNYVWHTMSAPVAKYRVQINFVGDYVCAFAENTNSWVYLNAGDTISTVKGYLVKTLNTGGKTVRFKGVYNTGNQSVSLTNTGASETNGYNLVGNPYPSAIDWNASNGWTKTNILGTIWIWNPTTNNYATWDGTIGTNGGSRYIPAMQGFFVKVDAGYTTGNLSMTNSIRVQSNQTFYKSAKSVNEVIRLRATGKNCNDEVVFYKAEGDNGSYKFFSPDLSVLQIYAMNNDLSYSISRFSPDITDTIIQIGFRCNEDGPYSINIDELSFDPSTSVYLIDKLLNNSIKLTPGTIYNFNHNHLNPENRFELVLKSGNSSSSLSNSSVKESNDKIKIWSYSNNVYIDLQTQDITKSSINIYNILGELVISKNSTFEGIEQLEIDKKGIYIVTVINDKIRYSTKVLIK